ncbi:MAG TPA: BatD family protein [Thermoanaerobaculia bacterium]|nr:BatD family protein [Thermoanaerobaculia bacterium]
MTRARAGAVAALLLLLAAPLSANELYLDRQTINTSENVTITVTLDGPFASLDSINIPLQNLVIEGDPSTATSFSFVNGVASHQRVLRYVARPRGEGRAVVGPITLELPSGQRDTLDAVTLNVEADRAAGSNDPLTVLRGLMADGRPPVFVVASVDRNQVFAGQEIVVTWTLYNAASLDQWGITEGPKLDDFWAEEIAVNGEMAHRGVMDNLAVEQLMIRRVALFPLRSGTLTIGPLGVAAAVLMPTGGFEGRMDEVRWRSAPLTIDVKPLPPGPPVDASGDLAMRCAPAVQTNGGPVVVPVTLIGRGNLRAASPPRFAGPLAGTLQVGEGKVSVSRSRIEATMTRTWRYLVFPSHDGRMTLPPIVASIADSNGARQQLRCEAQTLNVEAATDANLPPPGEGIAPRAEHIELTRFLPWLGGVALIVIALVISVPRLRRSSAKRRELDALVRGRTPAEVRGAVDGWLLKKRLDPAMLVNERSDRGDALRSLRSLLDALEHERIENDPRELRARVADLIATIAP